MSLFSKWTNLYLYASLERGAKDPQACPAGVLYSKIGSGEDSSGGLLVVREHVIMEQLAQYLP